MYHTALDQAVLRLWVDLYGPGSQLAKYLKEPISAPRAVPSDPGIERKKPIPRRRLEPLRQEVADIVDKFLTAVIDRKYQSGNSAAMQRDAPWTQGLPHLLGCDFHLVHEFDHGSELERSQEYYYLAGAKEYADTFWPIDFAVASFKPAGDPYREPGEAFFINRIASVEPKEARGLTKITPPKILHLSTCYLYLDRPVYAEGQLVGLVNGKWQNIEPEIAKTRRDGVRGDTIITGRWFDPSDRDRLNDTIHLTMAARLTHRYEWHVAFGPEAGPRLVIPASPRACLVLFRDRELRVGETRRSALRHWVGEHWREKVQKDDFIYVCQHLRGATRFLWKGVPCELMVSEHDLERNEFFRTQAAEWRAMRKHNRVRVRLKQWKSR